MNWWEGFAGTSISSSTTISSKTPSTTSRVSSTSISSSTTMSASRTTSTTNAISSSTPNMDITKRISSVTPEEKGIITNVPKRTMDAKISDIELMIRNNIDELMDDNIQVGTTYNLGELPITVGDPTITFSSEIVFHDDDTEAVISYLPEINASVTELQDFINDEFSIEILEGSAISIDRESMSMSFEWDGYSMEIDMMSLIKRKLDVTFSKSTELGEEATLTNSINFVKEIGSDDAGLTMEELWDAACEGAQEVLTWLKENSVEVAAFALSAVTVVGIVATGGVTIPTAVTTALAGTLIFDSNNDDSQEVK